MRISRSWIGNIGGVALFLAMQPLAARAAVTCSEVSSQVNFQGLQALPAAPTVGDTVELHFDVTYFVYSVTRLQLQGAGPLLEETTSLSSTRDATFQLAAVHG